MWQQLWRRKVKPPKLTLCVSYCFHATSIAGRVGTSSHRSETLRRFWPDLGRFGRAPRPAIWPPRCARNRKNPAIRARKLTRPAEMSQRALCDLRRVVEPVDMEVATRTRNGYRIGALEHGGTMARDTKPTYLVEAADGCRTNRDLGGRGLSPETCSNTSVLRSTIVAFHWLTF